MAARARSIVDRGSNLLATRADTDAFQAVSRAIPEARFNGEARNHQPPEKTRPCSQGPGCSLRPPETADCPWAAESLETGKMLGLDISMAQDIGVAGIHRVMHHRDEILAAAVIIVVAAWKGRSLR